MPSPNNAIQAGLYARLTGYAPLTSALGQDSLGREKVYDFVPQGVTAPYVVIGNDTLLDVSSKSNGKWEVTVTIHTWDFEKAGRKSVKTLLGHIYDALHQQEASLTVTGFTLVQIRFEHEETFQDITAEGDQDRFYHGVHRYRAFVHA